MTNTTAPLVDDFVTPASNYIFVVIYICCILFGVPGNIISLQYFLGCTTTRHNSSNKAYFNLIYILISVVDLLICATLVPNIITFLKQREPGWFGNTAFCEIWGGLWETFPYLSVYLVGVMSISRTLVLIRPLSQLKTQSVWIFTGLYTLFLVLRTLLPVTLGHAVYEYSYTDVFCYELPQSQWAYKFNSISRVMTLAAPVIPICISCFCSYIIIMLSTRKQVNQKSSPTKATMTILIFTIVYIVFNIPVFLNYLLMCVASSGDCKSNCYMLKYKDHKVLIWFSWNFTYITCVALNSTINPAIYYLRMKNVKDFVDENFRKSSRVVLGWRKCAADRNMELAQYTMSTKVQNGSRTSVSDTELQSTGY